MGNYLETFMAGYKNYSAYLWNEITHPTWNSYFYWLILVSVFFFLLEVVIPWRKKQTIPRKDFWLDGFYMFFNFFLFSLIIYNAASDVVVNMFNDVIKAISGGFDLQVVNPMRSFPLWAVLLIGMVFRDFTQWWIHRLLHRVDWLWQYHKVHHSVQQMGFAAQLRYHWMENIIYRSLEYIPLALLGIGLYDFFIIHIFALAWGHYNHANISISTKFSGAVVGGLIGIILSQSLLDVTIFANASTITKAGIFIGATGLGAIVLSPLMRYFFNSPEMHIWHHSYDLPEERRFGVNFGLTLAVWDYLFGTDYIPHDGRDIRLGFPGIEEYPDGFVGQNISGFGGKQANQSS